MLSYEIFMGMSLMGVVMIADSFNITEIVEAQRGMWFCVPQFLGFIIFFIAGIAETRRLPFDLPEAESELVAGYHCEYSGMKFGMFFVGEYIGITLDIRPYNDVLFWRLAWAGSARHSVVFYKDFYFHRNIYSFASVASPSAL